MFGSQRQLWAAAELLSGLLNPAELSLSHSLCGAVRALCSAAAIGLRHGHGTEVFFRSLRYTEKELRAFSNGSQHFTRDYS